MYKMPLGSVWYSAQNVQVRFSISLVQSFTTSYFSPNLLKPRNISTDKRMEPKTIPTKREVLDVFFLFSISFSYDVIFSVVGFVVVNKFVFVVVDVVVVVDDVVVLVLLLLKESFKLFKSST